MMCRRIPGAVPVITIVAAASLWLASPVWAQSGPGYGKPGGPDGPGGYPGGARRSVDQCGGGRFEWGERWECSMEVRGLRPDKQRAH